MPKKTTPKHPSLPCPFCGVPISQPRLTAASWFAPEVLPEVQARYPIWSPEQGGCPNCVRLELQRLLTNRSLDAPRDDPPAGQKLPAWECLPSPFRVGADPRFTGHGVTMAMIDAAFYPHPDLIRPRNRIRAWVDATGPRIRVRTFRPDQIPQWPDWNAGYPSQWHGLMASSIAAGNGRLSQGLYRGLASDADLILVQTINDRGRITNPTLARAVQWLVRYGPELRLKVVSFSVAGDPLEHLEGNAVDAACRKLYDHGVTLIAAVGNSGKPRLVPPATAPWVIAVGGVDDRDRLDPDCWEIWHSNYGRATDGSPKPDLVAPSWRVVAPILPGTSVEAEAKELFHRRQHGDRSVEARIDHEKLVTPHYQHMDGTSVSAPIVAGTVACMLQANPFLTPEEVRELLTRSAQLVPRADTERQGAGMVRSGMAVQLALAERFGQGLSVVSVDGPAPRSRRRGAG